MAGALRSVMVRGQAERACLRCHLSADLLYARTLHYVEEWTTENDLRNQILSARFQSLIAVMETAAEPPSLTVEFVDRSSGLEYVEAVFRSERR